MQRKSFSDMNCSIARALDQVGEWWSLLIVRECTQGSSRFAEFQSGLGIAKNVLASRLERLTELGILERFPLEERANADGYRLTKKGEELYPIIVALMQWGDRWATPSGKPSVALVDDKTGSPIESDFGSRARWPPTVVPRRAVCARTRSDTELAQGHC